jgi:hypothetical protein
MLNTIRSIFDVAWNYERCLAMVEMKPYPNVVSNFDTHVYAYNLWHIAVYNEPRSWGGYSKIPKGEG